MENTSILTESKYIRSSGEVKAFSFISFMFFFTLYVMPQYFGFPLPVFDFTVLRIMLIIMFLFILGIKNKQRKFLELIAQAPYSRILIPYLFVLIYTAVFRTDINAFLNPVLELISFYLLIYVIGNCFGVKKTLEYILVFSWLLTVLGLAEYLLKSSPFSYLETIPGLSSGRFFRSGYYRIMGPANHSLGYGLILITMIPVICYDIEKEEINLLRHKLLMILAAANVFLTGSRSTLAVFLLEILMLALFSTGTNKKSLMLGGGVLLTVFIVFLLVFRNNSRGILYCRLPALLTRCLKRITPPGMELI